MFFCIVRIIINYCILRYSYINTVFASSVQSVLFSTQQQLSNFELPKRILVNMEVITQCNCAVTWTIQRIYVYMCYAINKNKIILFI